MSDDLLNGVAASDEHLIELEKRYLRMRSDLEVTAGDLGFTSFHTWLRTNGAWAIPIMAVLLVADRVLLVAHGNPTVALGIVGTTSSATILVGIAIQIFPYAVATLLMIVLDALAARLLAVRRFRSIAKLGTYSSYDRKYWTRVAQLTVAGFVLFILAAFTVEEVYWSGVAFFLAIAGAVAIWGPTTTKWKLAVRSYLFTEPNSDQFHAEAEALARYGRLTTNVGTTWMLVFIALFLFGSSVWAPVTQFQLANGRKVVGYHLATSDAHVSVLEDATRNIVTLKVHSIDSQHFCELGGQWTTLFQLVHLQTGPQLPPCTATQINRPKRQH